MAELARRVFYVSLSLRGPDSLPGTPGMLALCLIPWAAISISSNLLVFPQYPAGALLGVALELLLLFGYSRLVLQLAGKPERWPQTLVSLVGVQALIVAAALPLAWLSARIDEPPLILQAGEFGFLAWWLVAMANILSQATGRSMVGGVLLALGHFVLSLMVYAFMFEFMGVELPQA